MIKPIRLGLSLSLSGAYAAMGRQAEAALRLAVSDINQGGGIRVGGAQSRPVVMECLDDASDPARCAEIYRQLCFTNPVDILLGPYSSRLARAAAPIAGDARRVMINHGGADDELYARGDRTIVAVLSCASDYMARVVPLLAALKMWRKRLAIIAAPTPFAKSVARGVENACAERTAKRGGVRIRVKYSARFDPEAMRETLIPALARNRVNAVVSAGDFTHDVGVIRMLATSHLYIPVLSCVAAGVEDFGRELGDLAEGVVGPSQWEAQARITPELGPSPEEFEKRFAAEYPRIACDYPAAQAYAAAIVAKAAIEISGALDQMKLREAFSDMKTSTLFGDFQIDRVTGRQIAHQILLVQWHGGRKVIIDPEIHAETGEMNLPSGFSLILASFRILKLKIADQLAHESGDEENDNDSTPRD